MISSTRVRGRGGVGELDVPNVDPYSCEAENAGELGNAGLDRESGSAYCWVAKVCFPL